MHAGFRQKEGTPIAEERFPMTTIFRRLLYLFRRSREDADLREEIEAHRALRQEAMERDGLAPADAAVASRRALGNIALAAEDARDVWTTPAIDNMSQDARYALRALRRSPAFAAVAVLTLALGLGANSALFGIFNAAFFRMPAGIPETDRLVRISLEGANQGRTYLFSTVSYPDFRELAGAGDGLESLAAFTATNVAVGSPEAVRARAQLVSADYFAVLGVSPRLGRGFVAEEDEPTGIARVVVISHDLWRRMSDDGRAILGETLSINGHAFEVVGVAPEGFIGTRLEDPADLWLPIAAQSLALPQSTGLLTDRENARFYLIGRLAPDVEDTQAEAALSVVGRRVADAAGYPDMIRRCGAGGQPAERVTHLPPRWRAVDAGRALDRRSARHGFRSVDCQRLTRIPSRPESAGAPRHRNHSRRRHPPLDLSLRAARHPTRSHGGVADGLTRRGWRQTHASTYDNCRSHEILRVQHRTSL
jgi:hypothetical protein